MSLKQVVTGKSYALLTLARMCRFLVNWREVWNCHRRNLPIPSLIFRRGFTVHHDPFSDPRELFYEIFARKAYRQFVFPPAKGVMVDIGANIGMVDLDFISSSNQLTIHAYEPNPTTYRTLVRNIAENNFSQRVITFREAVGRKKCNTKLWINVPSILSTTNSQNPCVGRESDFPDARREDVPMIGLDDVVNRIESGEVALLKIDAEGAEADILEGAQPSTLNRVRQVVLEYHLSASLDMLERCTKVLKSAGFICVTRLPNMLYATRPGT